MCTDDETTARHPLRQPLKFHWEIKVVDDPDLRRQQLNAIREVLEAVRQQRSGKPISDATVGDLDMLGAGEEVPRADGLDALLGPLQAEVVRTLLAARGPQPVTAVLGALNANRTRSIGYTGVQAVMARLTRRRILIRYRLGRRHLYQAAASDAAGIAVRELLDQFGRHAVTRLLQQASADPDLRNALKAGHRYLHH